MIILLMSNSVSKFIVQHTSNKTLSSASCPPVAEQGNLVKKRSVTSIAFKLTITGLLGSVSFPLFAVTPQSAQLCLPDLISPLQAIPPSSNAVEFDSTQSKKTLEADQLTQPSTNRYLFEGNAILKQPGLVVLSDQMLFDQNQKEASFTGHVELHQPELIVNATQANIYEQSQSALLTDAQYQILPSRVYGQSARVHIQQQGATAQLDSATLTVCKQQPNKSLDWQLKFKEIEINNETEQVVGLNTTLLIKGVPVFYTPYFAYSLADRATGFLFADFGSTKSLTYNEQIQYLKIPYYFNIAKNMDDTLTVIPMSKRGVVLDNEFRYLNQNKYLQHSVKLNVSGMQDQLAASEGLATANTAGQLINGDTVENRWRASLDASQNWGKGLTSHILWHETSDENFYADIPVNSALNTVTQTPRHLKLNYQKDDLQVYAQVLSYLRLRNAPLNYEKRPEVGLKYRHQIDNASFNIQTSATEFVLPISEHSRPEALRFNLKPSIDYQVSRSYGAIKATVVGNQTQYQMHDNGHNNTGDSTHSLFIPQFALKGGLIFERQFELFGKSFTQTLEPEAQYLNVPYQNQANLPLFDTGSRSLAFSNLFALNRFSGSDRIGDANQISAALTTRLLDQNGRQIADAGIGQIAYFQDRLVGLRDNIPQTDKFSDVFLKLGLNAAPVSFSSTLQLNKEDYTLLHANSRIKYDAKHYGVLLANHVLTNYDTPSQRESLSLGGYTQITQSWQLGAYVNYDMYNQQLNHRNLGLRYDSCCWAIEIIAERTQLTNGLYNDEIQFQFELKGLSTAKQTFKNNLSQKLNF